ncbi:MAG TPA: hypothetical protein VGG91_17430 [Myxococcaceae bacterium]
MPPISNFFTVVVSLALPPGSFLVTAKVVLTNATAGATGVTCVFTQSGSGSILDWSDGTLTDGNGSATLVLHTAAKVIGGSDAHVRVSCQRNSAGTATVTNQQITAIQLGSLATPGP